MKNHVVLIAAFITVAVVAAASAVISRYPGADFGSVADWFGAAGSIVAAVAALYIARHEAKRARDLLAEEKVRFRQERIRGDAVAVATAVGALGNGIQSFSSFMKIMNVEGTSQRTGFAKVYSESHHFKSPTSEMELLSPSVMFLKESAMYILDAKNTWNSCVSKMTFLRDPSFTKEQIPLITDLSDALDVLREGYALQWRLDHDQWTSELPADEVRRIEKRLRGRDPMGFLTPKKAKEPA